MLICENNNNVLFAGCAHRGIINIINKATEILGKTPTHVIAGMHLAKSDLSVQDEEDFLVQLANKLNSLDPITYYTMHCTGEEAYKRLKQLMGNQIHYLSCGQVIEI